MSDAGITKRIGRLTSTLAIFLVISGATLADQVLPTADAVFPDQDPLQVELGHLLFYDPILSGSKTVSCATCHHPRFGTSDGLSLGLGDGAAGLGPDRQADPGNLPEQRIPRNAPALFNLGAPEFQTFFADGRLEADPSRPSGIRTPLGEDMALGFASVLSAQSMFPVLSPDEMAGHYSENDVAQAVRLGLLTGPDGAWDIIARRVDNIDAYRMRFDILIGDGKPIHFTDISDSIAAFIAFEWQSDQSPFDTYLRGGAALDENAQAGMDLFYGKAGCARCHSGQFQTDHRFHAIAMPQIGPGKAARFEDHQRDTGRMRVTGDPADAYKFRTPSLRNVALTAPYGHAGTHLTLEDIIRHHLDPVEMLKTYQMSDLPLPGLAVARDETVLNDPQEMQNIAQANTLKTRDLGTDEILQLVAFLKSLTDHSGARGRLGVPVSVPSGVPVDQ